MKKSFVFILAVLLVVAFTLPASALENKFGGYWRTRIYNQQNFRLPGVKDGDSQTIFDTRTRLYYDAIFSDNFKFVNKFEFDARWGDTGYGDFGTDGKVFEIKHSFVDFRMGPTRTTVGAQGAVISRGFVFDDDFAGAIFRYQPGGTGDLLIPFAWITRFNQQDTGGDVVYLSVYPSFPAGSMSFTPHFTYGWANGNKTAVGNDFAPWWLGVDFDFKSDAFSVWASGIYMGGSGSERTGAPASPTKPLDNKGYLLAGGVDFSLGAAGLWVDFIYATGQGATATDNEAFYGVGPAGNGNSYYWAEIMGLGIFDNAAPTGAPGNDISNLMTAGVGLDLKTGDKLKWNFDLWYATLAEKNAFAQDKLGVELDIILNWNLMENLNLDLVFAYLAAGDAVSATGKNQEDPMEIGARLSFGF